MAELPPSLRRPRETYADYYDFVSLDDEWDAFDMSPSIGTDVFPDEGVYYGKQGTEWADTALYRLIGDRWVLIFFLFDEEAGPGPVDRELTPAQAARYLRLNELAPPPGLRPAPSVYNDAAERRKGQARLDRDWHPPVSSEAGDDGERTVGGPAHEEAPGADRPTPPDAAGPSRSPGASVGSEGIVDIVNSATEIETPIIPVVLNGPDGEPVVYGKAKRRLTRARYNVVKTLMDAGRNLSKDELDRKSGHTEARKLLRALADSDPDWDRAIIRPEGPGTGYGIRR